MRERRLPLGIDLGARRVRVAALAERSDGSLRVLDAVAVDRDGTLEETLRAALRELRVVERRAVFGICSAAAVLHRIHLPAMSRTERDRVARFEAAALLDRASDEMVIRCIDLPGREVLIAAAPRRRTAEIARLASSVGLRRVVIDHEGLAWLRAGSLPLLDIGFERSTLALERRGVPIVREIALGGETFTRALAAAYATSRDCAEARKCSVGLTGAAEEALQDFARHVEGAIAALGSRDREIGELSITGNGSRLPELPAALESVLGITVRRAGLPERTDSGMPPDVERGVAPDWLTAVALATHHAAAGALVA